MKKRQDFFKSPIDGFVYYKSDETDPTYRYYGFQSAFREFYIMRLTVADNTAEYYYNSDVQYFAANWNDRATGVTYQQPYLAFASVVN